MLTELSQWETEIEALRARLATVYPDVKVNLSIQITGNNEPDDNVLTVVARDYSTPDAPIVFSAGEVFPGIPTISGWLTWLASAPV